MKRKNLTPADVAKYVKGDGGQCPCCGSENIQAGDTDTEQGGKYQRVECLNPECEASWVDVFHLVGVMPGTDDDGDGAIYADEAAVVSLRLGAAKAQLRKYHDLVLRLTEWAESMGGWESPVWSEALEFNQLDRTFIMDDSPVQATGPVGGGQ